MKNDKSLGRAFYICDFFSRKNSRTEDVEADTEAQYHYQGHNLPWSIPTAEESHTLTKQIYLNLSTN